MLSELWRPLLVFGTFLAIIVLILVLIFSGGGGEDEGEDTNPAVTTPPTVTIPPEELAGEPERKKHPDAEEISAKDLEVGDCLAGATATTGGVRTFDKIDCDKPHNGEVFTIIKLPDTAKYPGRKFASGKGQRGCRARLRRQATAKAFADPQLNYIYVYPTAQSWAQDDREVTCIATFKKDRTTKLEQRGSDDA